MRLLVLLSRVPYPLEKGDKLRAFNQIQELSKKHEIILFAINDGPVNENAITELKKYCSVVSVVQLPKPIVFFNLFKTLFSGKPFQVGYFHFRKARKTVEELINKYRPDHIYCQLIRSAEYAIPYTQIPKTLDYMDVFSKGMERRKSKVRFYLKPILAMEHRRLIKYEQEVFQYFDNKTIISEQDKNFMIHPEKVKIAVIPNGVNADYFKPLQHEKEFELLFNGNMSYPPNVESVEYLVNNIMPLVWNKLPAARLLISGASPVNRVLALQSDKVIVSGYMEDIRENYAKSKVLVAPMLISIGLQNKLLEAMAMQLPCVTSTLANNALGAKHDEQIMVADTPQEYAQFIIELLENQTKAGIIAKNGYDFVMNNYNWQKATAKLEKLMNSKNI